MKKQKRKKEKKKIKIGPFNVGLYTIIDISLACLLLIIHFSSPKVGLIVTQKYNQGTEEQNNSVRIALGEDNTEEKFNLYFLWYNVLHEVGHGVIYYNGNKKFNDAEAEQLVNDFAYAYWDYYGNQEKLNQVEEIINYAHNHIENEEGRTMNYMDYAKKNWNKKSFYTFNNYGYFQFSSVKETFKNRKNLETVLKEMGITTADLTKTKVLNYSTINKDVSDQILYDAIDNIHEWGLKYPTTYHKYTTNPYYSYFKPTRKYLYDLTMIFDKSLSD